MCMEISKEDLLRINAGFGGNVSIQSHVDGIIRNPTVFVGGKKIMDKGMLLV